MTTPTPPTPPPEVDPLILFGHKLRDDADLLLTRYRVTLVFLVALFALVGWKAYEYHEAKLARLEAQATVEHAAATNEAALADAWKTRALTLADSVKHDTVKVRQVIQRTKTDTMWVPATPAAPIDGVTYSGPAPLVPIPVVARADFDSLGASCTRVEHDCAATIAAKDSALAHQDSMAAALRALNANTEQRLTSVKRIATLKEGGIAAFFYFLGRVLR